MPLVPLLPAGGEAEAGGRLQDLVKRARGKQLAPDEYSSGNFFISNMGMFGADTFDAILPPGGTPRPHAHAPSPSQPLALLLHPAGWGFAACSPIS